jgi:hypothetical protein
VAYSIQVVLYVYSATCPVEDSPPGRRFISHRVIQTISFLAVYSFLVVYSKELGEDSGRLKEAVVVECLAKSLEEAVIARRRQ